MTPKEKRDLLFKGGRPNIRPMNILDENGYHRDVAICWLAHSVKPFYAITATDQADFALQLMNLSEKVELLIAEDFNGHYESGRGPIAIVGMGNDGWRYEPHTEFFPWATKKNILRSTVAFLQMIRYKKSVGVCVIKSLEDSASLFHHCRKYGVIHYNGVIPGGDPRGDEYQFSVRGKR